MAVNDHGLEVLKKAGVDIDGNLKKNYALQTRKNAKKSDSIEVQTTTITTSATRIVTPENCNDFVIFHKESGETVYIGDSDVTGASDGIPLDDNDVLELEDMRKNDGNNIYGIVASGTVVVYAIGIYRL